MKLVAAARRDTSGVSPQAVVELQQEEAKGVADDKKQAEKVSFYNLKCLKTKLKNIFFLLK